MKVLSQTALPLVIVLAFVVGFSPLAEGEQFFKGQSYSLAQNETSAGDLYVFANNVTVAGRHDEEIRLSGSGDGGGSPVGVHLGRGEDGDTAGQALEGAGADELLGRTGHGHAHAMAVLDQTARQGSGFEGSDATPYTEQNRT